MAPVEWLNYSSWFVQPTQVIPKCIVMGKNHV